ncbi:MAG: 8-oxo-dGTP diphosphatase [Candidatus Yonathbacteria bacterium]|nr:8-oxo-dGTP diphosphatase [Candidatus Yonathbacteria bacterium]
MKKLLTLCIIHQYPRVLLGMKKRGFGEDRWNGFGGKVEAEETIEEAAKREVGEEVGIKPTEMIKKGIINFEFENDPKILEVHIFDVTKWSGEPKESEEMRPRWFDIEEIPFDQMWPDDEHWIPLFLKGSKFHGNFLFDKPSDQHYTSKIIKKDLSEVEEL